MQLIVFVDGLILAAQVGVVIPVAYLCAVSISALIVASRESGRQRAIGNTPGEDRTRRGRDIALPTRFAILIPAHDEELLIGRLLLNLRELEYPADQYVVHVVADNCS